MQRIKKAGKQPILVTHVDHVGEISDKTTEIVRKYQKAGVQFINQTVLLQDVNDDPDILAATFEKLHSIGIHPYYLFQARPVKGATHFQVPFRRGVEIVHAVNQRLGGLPKTYRYIMSHYLGKIEILDITEHNHLLMRYHQCQEQEKIGKVFSRFCPPEMCWLEDAGCLSGNMRTIHANHNKADTGVNTEITADDDEQEVQVEAASAVL